jgi:4-hydroxybutyrate CoA-transferase
MSWLDSYQAKLQTAEDALRCVQSGMRVYIQPGCGEPETLVSALLQRAPFVRDVEVVHLLTLGCADYVQPEMAGHFRHNAFFIGGNVREAVNDGRADYTPIHLSEVESLFESRAMPLDAALIQVHPRTPTDSAVSVSASIRPLPLRNAHVI